MPSADLENLILHRKNHRKNLIIIAISSLSLLLITILGVGGYYLADKALLAQIMAKFQQETKRSQPATNFGSLDGVNPENDTSKNDRPNNNISGKDTIIRGDKDHALSATNPTLDRYNGKPIPPQQNTPQNIPQNTGQNIGQNIGQNTPAPEQKPPENRPANAILADEKKSVRPTPEPTPEPTPQPTPELSPKPQSQPVPKLAQPPQEAPTTPSLTNAVATQLALGYDALDKADFTTAKTHSDKALSLAKNQTDQQDVTRLQASIRQKETQQNISKLLAKAKASTQKDQWAQAIPLYDEALQLSFTPEVDAQKKFAKTVSQHLQHSTALLKDPDSLLERKNRQLLAQLKQQSRLTTPQSPRLQKNMQKLLLVEQNLEKPVAVTVKSDGKSFIRVLGVGNLGEITAKTITLKPGHYRLEAIRDGYRNQILRIKIPYNRAPEPIFITATEAI